MSVYDDIKERVKLSSVISNYVVLNRYQGESFKAKCPFHNEKTPSFFVHDKEGYYKCFGCSVQGDALDFLMAIEGLSHQEALTRMKQEAGIEDLFVTKDQRRQLEIEKKNRIQSMKQFKAWRDKLVQNLILYTNAQWKIYRTANKQFRSTQTEELEQQISTAYNEAIGRERALDELESMPDSELLEWFSTQKAWVGIKSPKWFLTGKRLELVRSFHGGV